MRCSPSLRCIVMCSTPRAAARVSGASQMQDAQVIKYPPCSYRVTGAITTTPRPAAHTTPVSAQLSATHPVPALTVCSLTSTNLVQLMPFHIISLTLILVSQPLVLHPTSSHSNRPSPPSKYRYSALQVHQLPGTNWIVNLIS